MYALRVSGAVNTQGFVWKFFLCAIYKFSFIHHSPPPTTPATDRAFPYELDPVARVVDVVGKAEVVDEQGVLHQGKRRPHQEDHEHVEVDHVALTMQTSAIVTTAHTTRVRIHSYL